ncbi:MAG: type I methionyl aminopeptidase [Deltaproteobacteria bacterium]|nr:type I methionyl aminopeptidase [Deltaproteobacteria bacterium]MBW2010499.1 type I methionyl aminopeptidase [Deltaproteobacteria bacterium]
MSHTSKKMKVRRNDPCPCGSGRKYKNCCLNKKEPEPENIKDMYLKKYKIKLKEQADIEAIRKAGRLVMETFDQVRANIKPGITTDEINTLVHDFTVKNQATPAPLNYNGFPKSVCVSVNEVICHGIPGERVLEDGDIVNVDITSILNGYYADANQTYFVGTPSEDAQKIVNVARECLRLGMEQLKPGNTLGDIGWAIQHYAESQHCSVVREFVGHGVGFEFHEPPQVLHYGKKRQGVVLAPGMVFTIEPMINLGKKELNVLDDGWTAVTRDGSLSAQFEQTLVVTEDGFESLTPFDLK